MAINAQQSARTLWRTISTNLVDATPRAVLFVSSEGNEGEAEAALLTCRSASAEGFEVCLVVTDEVDGSDAKLFDGIGMGSAATTIALAGHDLAVERGNPGEPDILKIRLEGDLLRDLLTHSQPEGSNSGDVRDELLSRLNDSYAITIVLAGPVLANPYALLFADRVPGVVLLVRSGRTRVQEVNRAKSLIEAAGGQILGAVMTNRKSYLPTWLERHL